MAETKTKPTAVAPADFIAASARPADGAILCELMQRMSGLEPVMWGPSMVGFGKEHYRYESGREGDMFKIGFSPRKANLVLYINAGRRPDLLAKLGKHTTGVSCLYVKKLADIDMAVLEQIIQSELDRPAD